VVSDFYELPVSTTPCCRLGRTCRSTAISYVSTSAERDKWVVSMVVRSIFPQELPLLLQAAGLQMSHRFGNLLKEPFGATSPQQVCLCESAA
jgi:hypothetical protein